ncbi:MAG: Nif3-like dinuclear metal center hexameric protein [Gemmatimonadetes bacterium]|nr:Nif3-like dinuclear metal center hexameric protein [Gemmatimonadota bacterium]
MNTTARRLTAWTIVLVAFATPWPRAAAQTAPFTARQVVERVKAELKGRWTDDGIDSFKDGDPDTPITGVAVTMMATMDVLQRASAAGLNLVITHEPTFYSHEDRLSALEELHDPVTEAKREFIKAHHLVVFRLHDHWHFPARPIDPVVTGEFRALGWQRYQRTPEANVIELPGTTLGALASEVKEKLGAHAMRVIGDPSMRVSKVAFLPGAAGFPAQRATLARADVDVLLIGEAREWETVPYAADAITQGGHKALIVIGHVLSEQAGSDELARWLQPLVPGLPVRLIAAADPFWSPK